MVPFYVNAMGLIAALLTTGSFLPQVVRTWRRGAADISYFMLALFLLGTLLWLSYGLLLWSLPLIIANGVTAIQVLVIVALKARQEYAASQSAETFALVPLEAKSQHLEL